MNLSLNDIFKKILMRIYHKIRKQISLICFFPLVDDLIKQNRQIIIALPTVDWRTPLFQRPQHLAITLSKYLNYIYGTHNYQYDRIYGVERLSDSLIVTNLWREAISKLNHAWIFLLSTQQLVTISDVKKMISRGGRIIYDYVDEIHPDISGSGKMVDFLYRRHEYIKQSRCAELVLCVSKKLYDEMVEYYPKEKVLLVPNGVDYEHFQMKRDLNNIPEDLQKIVGRKRPIIGYYGAMANWLDYDLINQTARLHPEWQWVFLGIDYNGGLKKLDESLKNIHFLGQKNYRDLPKYGVWFDTAIIPFAKGEIAKSTSPLKMYEYMAMRIPVVATEDLSECYGYKGMFISANRVDDFVKSIKSALAANQDQEIIKALNRTAKENTWSQRAEIIYEAIKRHDDN